MSKFLNRFWPVSVFVICVLPWTDACQGGRKPAPRPPAPPPPTRPPPCFSLSCARCRDIKVTASKCEPYAIASYGSGPYCRCCHSGTPRHRSGTREGSTVVGYYEATFYGTDDCGHCDTCKCTGHATVHRCRNLYFSTNAVALCSCGHLYGSTCTFSCSQPGYELKGNTEIQCELDGWSSHPGYCSIVLCSPSQPPSIPNGNVACTGSTYGSVCTYRCDADYVIPISQRRSASRVCQANKSWTGGLTACEESKRPYMSNCSSSYNITTNAMMTEVNITRPTFVSAYNGAAITPVCNMKETENLTIGSHDISCTGTDAELETTAICQYTITVIELECPRLTEPENGALVCNNWYVFGIYCQLHCEKGFDIDRRSVTNGEYACTKGEWYSGDPPKRVHRHVPDCNEISRLLELELPVQFYYTSGDCSNEDAVNEIKQNFITYLNGTNLRNSLCRDYQADCTVDNVVVTCGIVSKRKKRDVSTHVAMKMRRWLSKQQGRNTKHTISSVPDRYSTRHRRNVAHSQLHTHEIFIKFDIVVKLVAGSSNETNEDYRNRVYDAEDTAFEAFSVFDDMLQNGTVDDAILANASDALLAMGLTLHESSLTYGKFVRDCPEGMTVNPDSQGCVGCGVGSFYNATIDDCQDCDPPLYQDEAFQRSCKACPPGTATRVTRAVNQTQCLEINECLSNPCLNNGTCIDYANYYKCECAAGYAGTHCTIHDCAVHDCLNSATCVGFNYGYSCSCAEKFTGSKCEHMIIAGNWSDWAGWRDCSASCGDSGVRMRNRKCNNPVPAFGGADCDGDEEVVETCNRKQCPSCAKLYRPIDGYLNCSNTDQDRKICKISCRGGYGFSSPVLGEYICGSDTDFLWTHAPDNRTKQLIFPRCEKSTSTGTIELESRVQLDVPCCNDEDEEDQILAQVQETVGNLTNNLQCINDDVCVVQEISIQPRDSRRKRRELGQEHQRQRRASDPVEIIVKIGINTSKNARDVDSALDDVDDLGYVALNMTEQKELNVVFNGTAYPAQDIAFNYGKTCGAGTIMEYSGVNCVPCRPGTFYTTNANNASETACALCELGYYQPLEAQSECLPCPYNATTEGRGSEDISDCVNGTFGFEEYLNNLSTTTVNPSSAGSLKSSGLPVTGHHPQDTFMTQMTASSTSQDVNMATMSNIQSVTTSGTMSTTTLPYKPETTHTYEADQSASEPTMTTEAVFAVAATGAAVVLCFVALLVWRLKFKNAGILYLIRQAMLLRKKSELYKPSPPE